MGLVIYFQKVIEDSTGKFSFNFCSNLINSTTTTIPKTSLLLLSRIFATQLAVPPVANKSSTMA